VFCLRDIFIIEHTEMGEVKHYINLSKVDKRAIWFITGLLGIVGFPYIRNFIVSVLIKLYELLVQHAIE